MVTGGHKEGKNEGKPETVRMPCTGHTQTVNIKLTNFMLYVLVLARRSLKVRRRKNLLFAVGKTKQTMTKMLIFMF